ncbi:MAG: hypothetical protein ACPGUY_04640, partial [Akkermansiaceae bacterium]
MKYLTLLLVSCALVSCGDKEDETPEPVKPTPTAPKPKQPAPEPVAENPAAPFRMLDGDNKLPTDSQLSEGSRPAGAEPVVAPAPDAPSTAVKPP